MPEIDVFDLSIRIGNYKCFGAEPEGFGSLRPVNVIVGRNNSGKSALLDLIAFAVQPRSLVEHAHRGAVPFVRLSHTIGDKLIRSRICRDDDGHPNSRRLINHYFGGKVLNWELAADNSSRLEPQPPGGISEHAYTQSATHVIREIGNPFQYREYRRIVADRDIFPEMSSPDLIISDNGAGLTSFVEAYLNRNNLPSSVIEGILLDALNSIFEPDAHFRRILVQKGTSAADQNKWEIYLEDSRGSRAPLSHVGSGIKTVLIALANLILIPHIRGKILSQFIFAFEELENNLHPAVQRRLFRYLRDRIVQEAAMLFLTTHSSVVIDLFSHDPSAQLLHVVQDEGLSRVKSVSTYLHGRTLIEDLGVRASDLLQANCIIWVEGPSDRIYLNRWIELWSNGELVEGVHFQCLTYGGSSIAHVTFDDPAAATELISALNVNGHAVVLIDSDKSKSSDEIKAQAKRVLEEAQRVSAISWVTYGREVENYIPIEVIRTWADDPRIRPARRFADAFNFIEGVGLGSWGAKKVELAHRICPMLTRPMLESTLDLGVRLTAVCTQVAEWNGKAVIRDASGQQKAEVAATASRTNQCWK